MLSWTNAHRMGHRLVSTVLRCRQCSRPAGELVGYADRTLGEARFMPLDTGFMPENLAGELRCGRCAGQLYLDDIEALGRNVPLDEAGGVPFADVVAGERELTGPSAA
ncbi:MAG: hypothetical protein NVSMB52_10130 [Chloroflexota bacterium]